MHAIRDTRVDVCLYFIPPHRLRRVGSLGWLPLHSARNTVLVCFLEECLYSMCKSASLCLTFLLLFLPAALQIDLQFMSELSGMVPVVPVLAKADTMTSEELKVSQLLLCCHVH
jgi:hypothetical protein